MLRFDHHNRSREPFSEIEASRREARGEGRPGPSAGREAAAALALLIAAQIWIALTIIGAIEAIGWLT